MEQANHAYVSVQERTGHCSIMFVLMSKTNSERKQLKANLREMVAADETGLQLDTQFRWVVSGIKDPVRFFQNLPLLLPPNGVVYFEGCSVTRGIAALYEYYKASNPVAMTRDTTFPVPECFHVILAPQFVSRLCELAEQLPLYELLDHIKGYKGKALIFDFHDAFDKDLLVSERVTEAAISDLCKNLNATYRQEPNVNKGKNGIRALLNAMKNPGQIHIAGHPFWRRLTWR
jgi:hypothetical protein